MRQLTNLNHFKNRIPGSESDLLEYSWPGNTRELLHELERAIVMNESKHPLQFNFKRDGTRELNHHDWLNPFFHFPEEGFDLENEILRLIEMAILQSKGNISEAARVLGVPSDYIRYRLKKNQ